MMYKHILVVVDGSEPSEQALQKAIHTVDQYGASLLIGHVIDTRSFPKASPYGDNLWKELKESADELLEKSKKQAESFGLKDVRTVLESGNPRVVIPRKLIDKHSVDLLIIGGSGRNTVERMLVGSVTEASVRRSPCDVLTVKIAADETLYNNLMVAVDGSEQAKNALAKAIEIAKIHKSPLKIINVVEVHARPYAHSMLSTQPQVKNEEDTYRNAEQKQMLEKYKQQAEEQGVQDVKTILYYGNPRMAIPRTLTDAHDIDLLVTAATGRGAVDRFFTGSVASASVHHAPSDVLTVKK